MCLILLAWRKHPTYPLIVAANRDELHARPAATAAFWRDRDGILAGRDLQAKGTWLGVARNGKFASVTNYRGGHDPKAVESRGELVARFLEDSVPASRYASQVSAKQQSYSGFNLLLADRDALFWLSNRGEGIRELAPGSYALGNLLLDTPEVTEIRRRFDATTAAMEPLFSVLETAKLVAPIYGTRCATVVLAGADGRVQFAERPFDAEGRPGTTVRYEFTVTEVADASAGA